MLNYKELIKKYNIPVPRYTSYPPANHFKEGISQEEIYEKLRHSNEMEPHNIAYYVHIPFCTKICFYCGCNACATRNEQEIEDYINALKKEIDITTSLIDKDRKISQIHFGGGTPNAIDVKYLKEIVNALKRKHKFTKNPEIAIECNPAWLDYQYIDELLEIGFNRISFGIQDFDAEILKNVNRDPSKIPISELMAYIRKKSPETSINLDFIYGLPGQTKQSFAQNMEKALLLKPDRLVTFSYAHVPWLKKHQQILEKKGLPSPDDKMDMFLTSRELLLENDYNPIGLDHYVLEQDELNLALKSNKLHRNFQGYCTRETTGQVYAFGTSAISQLKHSYLQNEKDVKRYIELINKNRLPVQMGYFLSDKEQIINETITEIMCNGKLDIKDFSDNHHISVSAFLEISQFQEHQLKDFIDDALIEYDHLLLKATKKGELFIRNIASLFDPAYSPENNKYSKSV